MEDIPDIMRVLGDRYKEARGFTGYTAAVSCGDCPECYRNLADGSLFCTRLQVKVTEPVCGRGRE